MTAQTALLLTACALAPIAVGVPQSSALAGTLKYLYTFSVSGEPHGENYPVGPLVFANGLLYGTAQGGGESGLQGALFSVDPATGAEANLYTFPYSQSDTKAGEQPDSGLVAAGGKLYGTTLEGHGAKTENQYYQGYGLVFSLNPKTGKVATVHGFNGKDGSQPGVYHPPLVYAGGAFYGTTYFDGPSGAGTVFKLVLGHGLSEVYTFPGTDSGCNPTAIAVDSGILYGTTAACGANGSGTVFQIDLSTGAEKTLYAFPANTLALGQPLINAGALIGVTASGGANGVGSIYKIDLTSGAYKLLHSFSTSGSDGSTPSAGLTINNGVVYGVTEFGPGPNYYGTLFSVNTDTGAETVLENFSYSGEPMGPLISHDGVLYGTTTNYLDENSINNGTVFQYTP